MKNLTLQTRRNGINLLGIILMVICGMVANQAKAGYTLGASITYTGVNSGNWNNYNTWAKALAGSVTVTSGSTAVTGVSTFFTEELFVGYKLYSNGGTLLGTVLSITDDTHLTLTANALGTGGPTIYTTARIALETGTITSSTGNATVTGTGTFFLLQFIPGDTIYSNTHVYIGTVSSIASNTSLTLTANGAVTQSPTAAFYGTIIPLTQAGTITTTSGSSTVTGSGTNFTSAQFPAGSNLFDNTGDYIGTVLSVGSTTSITLVNNAAKVVSGVAFSENGAGACNLETGSFTTATNSTSVTATGSNFTAKLAIGENIYTNTGSFIGTIQSITDNTHLTLVSNALVAISAQTVYGSEGMGGTPCGNDLTSGGGGILLGKTVTLTLPSFCASIQVVGTLAMGTNNLYVLGNSVNNTGTVTGSTGAVVLEGNAPAFAGSTSQTWPNIIINTTGTVTQAKTITTTNFTLIAGTYLQNSLATVVPITITGDYSQTGGTYNWTSGTGQSVMTLNGIFSQTGGTMTMTGTTINGQISFAPTTGTIKTFSATTPTNITNTNFVVTNTTNSFLQLLSNVSLVGSASVPQTFTVNASAGLDCKTFTILENTSTTGTSFILNSGSILITANANGVLSGSTGSIDNNIATKTFNTAANYIFNGSGAQNTNFSATTMNNFKNYNSGGTVSVNSSITVNGTLRNTTGGILDFQTNTLGGTISTGIVDSGTIKTQATASALPAGLDWSPGGGTVNYNASSGGQNVIGGIYAILTMGNTSGTQTATGSITATTLNNNTNSADVLNMQTNTLSVTTPNNTGTIRTQNTASSTPISSGLSWGGTVTYDASTGGQSVVAGNYTTLTMGNTSGTQTAVGNISATTLNNNTNTADILNMQTNTLTVTTPNNTGTIRTQNTASSTPISSGLSWGGTVTYDASTGGQTVVGGTYTTLTMGNTSGTQTAGGNIITTTLNNNTNSADILNMQTNTLTVTTPNNTGTIRTQNTSGSAISSSLTYGGTVIYDAASGGQTVVNNTYNNLTISNTSGTNTASVTAAVGGAFTVSSGGGNFTPSAGTITMNNGSSISNSGTLTFNNLTIAASATASTSSSFGVNGALTLNSSSTFHPSSGTITMNNGSSISNSGTNLTFSGLTIASSATVTTSTGFGVDAALTVNSAGNLSPSAGTISMNNGSSISNSGTLTFNNLTNNNSTNTSLSNGNITVNGTLAFSAGEIITGANKVIIANPGTAITGAGVGKYVKGNLQMNLASGSSSPKFEIGDAAYAPVTLSITGVAGTVNVLGKATQGADPNENTPSTNSSGINQSAKCDHYWTLTKSGGGTFTNYNTVLDFNATTNGGTPSNYVVRKYDPSTWAATTSNFSSNKLTTTSNFTNFSDFEVGTPNSLSITCPTVNVNNDAGNCSAVVNFTGGFAATSGSVPTATITYSPVSGTAFAVGSTTVTATATNINGTSTCSFNVVVTDNEAPAAHCQAITVQLDNTGNKTIAGSDIDNASTDNCGIASRTASPNNFTCSNVGANTVTLLVTDVHSNTSTCSTTVTVQDHVAPVATCKNITVQLDNTGNVSIAGTDVNNGSTDACGIASYSAAPNHFTCSNVGGNTVTLTVTDVNGNSSTCSSTVTVQDNVAPVATCQNITVQLDNTGNVSIAGTDVNNGSSDACGIATYVVSPNHFTCSNVGGNTVTLTVTDVNGNSSTCSTTVTVQDNVVPVATCQNITVQLDNTGNVSIAGTDVNNGSSDACGIATYVVSPNHFTCSNVGGNTVTLTVTDVNGNSSTCSTTVTIQDNVVPVATCKNITVQLDNTGNVSIAGTDVNNGSTDACGIASYSAAPNHFTCSNVGGNTVTLTVTDNNSNTSTCSSTVTVQDHVAPVANCQAITIQLDEFGNTSIVATNVDNVSTDACGILSYNVSQTSFDCSNVGGNIVTLTVTDVNGNSSTCSTTVTVQDNIAPVVYCQSITVQLDNTGNVSIVGLDVDGGSTDACGILSYDASPNAFDCSLVGDNTVTLTVTDVNSNSSTCNATVTVQDNVAPVPVCQNITVQLDNTGNVSIVGLDVDGGSTDACGIFSYDASPNSFDCSNVGNNTVTLTVTDYNTNASSCNATVTVQDNVAPVALCQSITVQLDEFGNASISGIDIDGGSTDACGIFSYDASPNSFDCINVGDNTVILTVTDNNLNTSTCNSTVTVQDNVLPTAICVGDLTRSTNSGLCTYTAQGTEFDPTVSDNCSVADVTNDYNGLSTLNGAVFNQGGVFVTWTVTDVNGNSSICSTTITIVDTESPTIDCVSGDQSRNTDPSFCYYTTIGSEFDPIDYNDNCTSTIYNDQNFDVTLNGYQFPVGTTLITWYVIDGNDNISSCTTNVIVSDNELPTILCSGDLTLSTDEGNCTYTPQGSDFDPSSYSDNCSVSTDNLTYSLSGATIGDGSASLVGIGFNTGTTTVTWTITDGSGNTATCSFNVTINDNELPTITCAFDDSRNTDPDVCTYTVQGVEFDPINFADNCSVLNVVNDQNNSNTLDGVAFVLGSTTVTWTVTDNSGNTSTCTTIITVNDTQIPTISCTGDQTVSTDQDNCFYTVQSTEFDPTDFNDNCSGISTSYSLDGATTGSDFGTLEGVTFNKGLTTVTWTITDIGGNTATCGFNVTVIDDVFPTINCAADQTFNTDPGYCTFLVTTELDPTSYGDNCSYDVTYSLSGNTSGDGAGSANGTYLNTGSTTITWTITDASGNITTCSTNITVNDIENPTITCSGDQTVDADPGVCYYTTQNIEFDASAGDNCSFSTSYSLNGATNSGGPIDASTLAGVTFNTGQTTITWTATDASGNIATCSSSVTVLDIEPPTITCANDQTLITDGGVCSYTTQSTEFDPTSFGDNCSGSFISNDQNGSSSLAGWPFNLGTTTVTWTVTDGSGNTSTCAINVTVQDIELPTITCSNDQTVNTDGGVCSYTTQSTEFDPTLFGDNCSGSYITNNQNGLGSLAGWSFNLGTTPVTWTVTDGSGNTATCITNVTVQDIELPTITCANDLTVNTDGGICTYTTQSTEFDPTLFGDNCSGSYITNDQNGSSSLAGWVFNLGTTPVTWTITDGSGNIATCIINITVQDIELPTITCAIDQTVNTDGGICTYTTQSTEFDPTSFGDNCSGSFITNNQNGLSSLAGWSFNLGTTPVTWTVTDGSGNIATCITNITVQDIELPTITCTSDRTVNSDAGVCIYTTQSTEFNPTSFGDNCTGSFITNDQNGSSSLAGWSFNLGTTLVTWTVIDESGNTSTCAVNVTVQDNESPTITCANNQTVNTDGGVCTYTTQNSEFDPTLFGDNCSGSYITNDQNGSSSLAGWVFSLGTTPVTWTVTDGSGNITTCITNITVQDVELPAITCAADQTANTDLGSCFYTTQNIEFDPLSFADNCSGVSIINDYNGGSSLAGAFFIPGNTTVTWTVTDGSGNSSTCSSIVAVVDNEPPSITCSFDQTVNTDPESCSYFLTGTGLDPFTSDNCSVSSLTNDYNFSSSLDGSTFGLGNTTIIWTVTDVNGNTSTCANNITVTDIETPTITCSIDQTVNTDPGLCSYTVTSTDFDPIVGDNCTFTTVTNDYNNSSSLINAVFNSGSTLVNWTVTDGSGNSNFCSNFITVNDNESPSITCANDQTVSMDLGSCYYTTLGNIFDPTFSDNCSGASVVNDYNFSSTLDGSVFFPGSVIVTWTVTDGSGNSNQCFNMVTVTDNEPPTISCAVDQTVSADLGVCSFTVSGSDFDPAANDNCSVSSVINDYNNSSTLDGATFGFGSTSVTWIVTDENGNTNSCSNSITVTDNEQPTISCQFDQIISADGGSCSYTTQGSEFDPTDYADNCSVSSVVNDQNNSNTLNGFAFPLGTTSVTWTITDGSGNTSNCITNITVLDFEYPTITCAIDQTVNTDLINCFYTTQSTEFDPTAFGDNCSGFTIINDQNGTNSLASWTFNLGSTTVFWTITDASGNQTYCNNTITVIDNVVPAITCQSDQTRSTDQGNCSYFTINTEFDPIFTGDNCNVSSIVNDLNNSNSLTGWQFSPGNTTVTWTVTDDVGNTSTCSFVISVFDQEPPTINCAGDQTVYTDLGVCSYTTQSSEFDPSFINDNCSIGSVINDQNFSSSLEGVIFDHGTTIVTWTITDIYGNVSTCSNQVTVLDGESPTITCANDQVVNTDPGNCYYTTLASEFDPVIFADNCSGATIINDQNFSYTLSGQQFSLGSTIVTWTVTDIDGNQTQCTTTVTVVDNELPIVNCINDQTINTDLGSCSYTVQFNEFDASFSDNCSGASLVNNITNTSTLGGYQFPIGSTSVIWTVTDENNNAASCSTTITVIDQVSPTITCTFDQTVNTDLNVCTYTTQGTEFDPANISDNCSISSVVNNLNNSSSLAGYTFNHGTTTAVWTVTDNSGNTSTCSNSITVFDGQSPSISCIGDQTVNTDLGNCTYTVQNTGFDPSYSDNCSANIEYTLSGSTSGIGSSLAAVSFNSGLTSVDWVATDIDGNTSGCSFNITVLDNQNPVITCSGNLTQNADAGNCDAVVTFNVSATDNCDANVVSNPSSGSVFPVGTSIVNSIATDLSGNTSTCSFNITVVDNQNPIITCSGDITQSNDPGNCSAAVTFNIDATDNCDISSIISTPASGDNFPVGNTTVNSIATDVNGNTSSCSFIVTVVDDENPVITCSGNITQNASLGNCSAVVTFSSTATDNCGVSSVVSNPSSGSTFNVGTTTITSTATDVHGNTSSCSFTVTVVDNQNPVITCSGNITQNASFGNCSAIVTFSSTATDNCGVSTVISNPASGSSFNVGTTTVTSTATDVHGNTSSCSFTVTVVDNQNPVITCSGNITQNADAGNCSAVVTFSSTATDNCAVSSVVSNPASGSVFNVGTTTVTSTATDVHGNTSSCSFTVTVVDNQNPVITCSGNITQNASLGNCNAVVTFSSTATDNCGVSSVVSSPSSGSTFNVGTTTVTSTATDVHGNTSSCSFTVTVLDNQNPVITCSGNITQNADAGNCSAVVTFNSTATDNCGVSTVISNPASGSAFNVGATTVTSTATDIHGNTSSCSFTITVFDNQAPVITCSANLTQNTDPGNCNAVVTYSSTATDNCSVSSIVYSPVSGSTFNVGSATVTSTATDVHGNTSSCSFIVTVVDNQNPVITCPGNITQASNLNCTAVVTFSVTATDNCSATVVSVPASGSLFNVGNTTVTSTATDASGNTSTCSFVVDVTGTAPAQPGPITGNTIVCTGTNQTYSISAVTGATSYTWTFPSGWVGTSTTTSVTVNIGSTSGNVSVTANSACGVSPAQTLAVTVGTAIPAQPGSITGNTTVCQGSTQTYSIASVSGATSYTWVLPVGWTGSSTTTSITVTAGSGGGNILVRANNGCGSSPFKNLTITVIHAPSTPGSIIGNTPVCAGSIQTYSIASVSGATSYTWTLPSGWSGTSTTTNITTTVGNTSGTISVTANNSCGSSAPKTMAITVNNIPAQPGAISGSNAVCQGTIQNYFVSPVVGATSYTWTLPSGWSGNSVSNTISVVIGASSGNVTVSADNVCGSSSVQTLAVTVTLLPSTPGSITGSTSPCQSSTQTYSIASVAGATSYTWTLPSGWSGNSTTTSITTTVGTNSGNITVRASNGCGSSAPQTLAVTVTPLPVQPGVIAGNSPVCAGSSQTYTIAAVTGATSYTWTLPSGWTGSSTTTSINVTVGSAGGTISVSSNNGCGSSSARTLAVAVNNIPAQPGTIFGNTTVCQNSIQVYHINAVAGATSYTWTLPSGWSGTSTSASITTNPSATSGNITVTANNGCGSSSAQTLAITVNLLPAQPGPISGNTSVCHSTSQTYSISPVAGASTYTWTIPSGWSGSSNTNSITLVAGTLSGNITVKANNGCGAGPIQTLAVTANSTPATPGAITGNSPVCSGTSQIYSVSPVAGATTYNWTLPSTWTGTSSTDSITAIVGTVGGNIFINASNVCGTSPNRTYFVQLTPLPGTPGTITGSNSVCAGSVYTYSIASVNNATSYLWTLPSGWSGSSTSTSITTTAGSAGGNVSVLAVNNCGVSNTTRTLNVTVNTNVTQPGSISGNTAPCQGSTQTYSIAAVTGATSYNWTLPSGWAGSSSGTSIVVTAGSVGGNITVSASNACGTSPVQTLTVSIGSIPAQPGSISGNTTVCQSIVQTYSVSAVAGATSYTWTTPSGWSGTSTTNSLTTTPGANSGNVSVTANNACGNSPVQTLAVTVNSISAVTITGNPGNYNFCSQISPTSVALMASSGYSSYVWSPSGGNSQTATVSSVNTYTVTATNGAGCTTTASKAVTNNCALVTSLSTTNITGTAARANWIQSQCRVNYTIQISVHGLNSWTQYTVSPNNFFNFSGLTLSTTYDWQIQTNCNTSGSINSGWSAIQTFTTLSSRMPEENNTGLTFNLYPNPASNQVTIAFATMSEGTYTIKLIDMFGKVVKLDVDNASAGENNHQMNLDGIAKGVYIVLVEKGDNVSKLKLVVQ